MGSGGMNIPEADRAAGRTRSRRGLRPGLAAASALAAWLVLAVPAAAQDAAGAPSPSGAADCDPRVAEALVDAAEAGVQADFQVIRHSDQGIRKPDSILDLSCVWDMFDYRGFNILYDPGEALDSILNLARRRVCSEANDVYSRHVGRSLDAGVFSRPVYDVPGARTTTVRGNVLGDAGIERERFRRLFGGAAQ